MDTVTDADSGTILAPDVDAGPCALQDAKLLLDSRWGVRFSASLRKCGGHHWHEITVDAAEISWSTPPCSPGSTTPSRSAPS